MSGLVLTRDDGTLRRLTLNRPEKLNALNTAMLTALAEGIRTAPAAGTALIVIDGAGERGFCAGGDVAEMASGADAFAAQERALRDLMAALADSAVPVITVTHGRTMGAGCIIACLGDIALGPEDLSFGFPEMRFGLYPAFVHAALCERLPPALAFQFCIGGRTLDAAEAWRHGLLTERLPAAGYREAVEARIAHHRQRLDGLAAGRRVRRMVLPAAMAERLDVLAPVLNENFGAPSTRDLLAAMPFARS